MTPIEEIQNRMNAEGIDWLILFSFDPHLCENVPDFFNERKRLLGFRGSAGIIILTADKVYFRTDSRYFLECERLFADRDVILVKEGDPQTPPLPVWLSERLKQEETVAVNRSAVSHPVFLELQEICLRNGAFLTDFNQGLEPLFTPGADPLEEVGAGKADLFRKRLHSLRRLMKGDALLLSAPDTIAWLTGFRLFRESGEDVFFYAWGWVTQREFYLFTDHLLPRQLPETVVRPYHDFSTWVDRVTGCTVQVSFNDLNENLFRLMTDRKNKVIGDSGQIRLLQTVKTPREIEALRRAANEERQIMLRFREWLSAAVSGGSFPTEWDVSVRLEQMRRSDPYYRGASFATIAAFGENGAVVHYKPDPESASVISPDGLLLLDCGIHSLHGTTDMTRVFWTGRGPAPAEAVCDYTVVLKAHIALARAVFAPGTRGADLDRIARDEARRGGVEYGHGTGHGIGWINCVHEPPFSISPSCQTGVSAGMVVSIEPGCYRKGAYGIRLENIYAVVPDDSSGLLRFERMTNFPFEEVFIDRGLLTEEEKQWLDENGTIEPFV